MKIRWQVVSNMLNENKLSLYDTINLNNMNYHIKYGSNIIKNDICPTLTTKSDILVVINE